MRADGAQCAGCLYWAPDSGEPMIGLCRRRAPLPMVLDKDPVPCWPTTGYYDWCGEWAPPPQNGVPTIHGA